MDFKIALGGFSPVGWVYKVSHPENFTKDFPSGIENFNKSAVAHIYRLAYSYLGISPETLLPIIMGIEIALLVIALYYLSRTLLPKAPTLVPILVAALFIASNVKELDIGRQGLYFEGKFDNIADAFRILAITMTLKNRPLLCGIFLAGSFIVHPVYSVMGGIFIFSTLLLTPREILRPKTITGVASFIIISGIWVFAMFELSNFSSGGISNKIWFDLSRFSSFHWFPVDYGLFTTGHQELFIQFIAFLLLLVFYISKINPLQEIDRKMLLGILSMVFFVIAGIIISMFDFSSSLVKFSLIRGDELIIIVGLIYIVNGLWNEFNSLNIWRNIAAAIMLISPFILKPGYPLLFSILLASPASILVLKGNRDIRNLLVFFITLASILLIGIYAATGMAGLWSSPAYTAGSHFKQLMVLSSPLLAALVISKIIRKNLIPIAILVIFFYCGVNFIKGYRPPGDYIELATSYKQTQLWARNHTPNNALFMTDPTIYYGWLDFSHRSSFGNLRAWIYNWANSMSLENYQEGMRRFNEFSIRLDDYLHEKPPIAGFSKLNGKVKEKYYSANDEWRMNLARKYGIDYFVMIKKEMTEPSMQQVVYENEHFLVLEAKLKPGTSKKWHEIITLDSDIVNSKANENLGWSTFSEGRPVTWPWGLTADNNTGTGTKEIYLNQPDKHDYWLYTGQGAITDPPNSTIDSKWHISKEGKYRLKVFLRGNGFTDIYIWWYDEKGRDNHNHIHRHQLSSEYEQLVKIFELPEEAKTFRISFLLRGNNAEPSTLFIKKLIAEDEEQ